MKTKIIQINKKIENRKKFIIDTENTKNISKVSLISTGSSIHAQSSELKFRF